VLGYYELWRINLSRREYYDFILGAGVTLATGSVSLGTGAALPWITGTEISLSAAVGAASAKDGFLGVGSFGEAGAIIGAGVAGYLVGTAFARLVIDGQFGTAEAERLDAGWEIVDRVIAREPIVTQGEPYWQRVTPIFECQAPEVTVLGGGENDPAKSFGELIGERQELIDGVGRLKTGTTIEPKVTTPTLPGSGQ
jgi:hypothetical protein